MLPCHRGTAQPGCSGIARCLFFLWLNLFPHQCGMLPGLFFWGGMSTVLRAASQPFGDAWCLPCGCGELGGFRSRVGLGVWDQLGSAQGALARAGCTGPILAPGKVCAGLQGAEHAQVWLRGVKASIVPCHQRINPHSPLQVCFLAFSKLVLVAG